MVEYFNPSDLTIARNSSSATGSTTLTEYRSTNVGSFSPAAIAGALVQSEPFTVAQPTRSVVANVERYPSYLTALLPSNECPCSFSNNARSIEDYVRDVMPGDPLKQTARNSNVAINQFTLKIHAGSQRYLDGNDVAE